jgi:hypothetical protein
VSLVQNERAKLLATTPNNLAVATFVTALIAPAASMLYGLTNPAGGSRPWALIGFCWFLAGIILHLAAQTVLKKGLIP